MSVRLTLFVAFLLSLLLIADLCANDIPQIVTQAKPAVVQIIALNQQNKPLKTGTGFFVSADGNLLTNFHVISGASSILAKTPSGAIYFFKEIVSVSAQTDVALLRFYATDVPHTARAARPFSTNLAKYWGSQRSYPEKGRILTSRFLPKRFGRLLVPKLLTTRLPAKRPPRNSLALSTIHPANQQPQRTQV